MGDTKSKKLWYNVIYARSIYKGLFSSVFENTQIEKKTPSFSNPIL